MNEIVNDFLLAGDKFMPDMHLRQPRFTFVLVDHLPKTRKESKTLKRQEIHDIFIKTNQINLVFNMIWIKEILKI